MPNFALLKQQAVHVAKTALPVVAVSVVAVCLICMQTTGKATNYLNTT